MKHLTGILWLLLFSFFSEAQDRYPFQFTLEPLIPAGFNGLQSYAWAKDGDKVLLAGGRTDGLHRRQPFAAFNKQYNNTELVVIDLKQEKVWKKTVTTLPAAQAEQLQSSNMEFFQQGNQLILVGGYGYSETKRTHITHPSLISIQVKELISAVINNEEIGSFIHQLKDERMAVTGGRLNKLGNLFYLVGGQRFDGRYNPHGPDHGPGFSQQYTNQLRKFSLSGTAEKMSVDNYSAVTDSLLLHRRDYNLLMQLDDAGNEMLSIYSGVFQYEKDIPFTNLTDITEKAHREVPGFNQLFSHYHTATLPAYHKDSKTMYSIFFGGIAQNYPDSAGNTVKDNDIPFVKTISVVERKNNSVIEYTLPGGMPGYFGAAAEFIPFHDKLYAANGILNLDKLNKKTTMIGYIIGGIDSRGRNVFWSNEAEPSRASPVIWKVNMTTK
jgi:hypothetical protein